MGAVGKDKLKLGISMGIFGTIGIFVRNIPLSSSAIALVRGVIGTVFLLLAVLIQRKLPSREAIKKNFWILFISGVFIGINWILLFEAYRYTTVATATLCYYLAPVFVILAAPVVLKEKLTLRKVICVAVALLGMLFVSGVLETGLTGIEGVLYGIGAAVFYASVMLLNQKLKDISAYDKTIIQLAAASVVLLPYTLLTENFSLISLDTKGLVLLLVVGIIHTGMAYAMYFDSMKGLGAQTVAIFSYIDPILAIILSALFLKEGMTVMSVIGAVLVLGATFVSELPQRRKIKTLSE